MHVDPEEFTLWSVQDILDHIRGLLASDQTFKCRIVDGGWVSCVFDGDSVVWSSGWSVDQRKALLDAFGWLWVRGKGSNNPVWNPNRRELTSRLVTTSVSSTSSDPQDVDPDILRSVYSSQSKARHGR